MKINDMVPKCFWSHRILLDKYSVFFAEEIAHIIHRSWILWEKEWTRRETKANKHQIFSICMHWESGIHLKQEKRILNDEQSNDWLALNQKFISILDNVISSKHICTIERLMMI